MEVFSAQGRDPVARWRLSGTIKKEYNKQVKGYVYVMEGGSSTTRLQLPKNERTLRKLSHAGCRDSVHTVQSGAWEQRSTVCVCVYCVVPAVGLQQHYCGFQLLVPDDARFAIELR